MKYQGARHLAPLLVDLALESDPIGPIGAPLADLSGAVIVPVPLHPRRLAERGYNQSAVLAAELGRRLGAAVRPSVLARVRDTRPQQELPRPLRQANVRGAFSVAGPPLLGQSVILVDDVCTTASTLREAAKALRAAGASTVDAFVIARAYHARHPALPPPAH